jgi:hypothetical protein
VIEPDVAMPGGNGTIAKDRCSGMKPPLPGPCSQGELELADKFGLTKLFRAQPYIEAAIQTDC